MIKNYIKMKKNEWRNKATVYGVIAVLLDNQKEFLDMIQKLYISLKDVPAEELRKEFVANLAEIIHNENANKND